MQIKIINKINNSTTFEDSKYFPSARYKDYVLIPEALWGKDVIWDEQTQSVIEKPVSLDDKKAAVLALVETKKKEPVDFQAQDIDGNVVNLQSTLTNDDVAYLLKVKSKADIAGQAQVSLYNVDTEIVEPRIYSQAVINQVALAIIAADDGLERAIANVQNASTIAEVDAIINSLNSN